MWRADKRIDDGKPFDWGRVSSDYAVYRDIYPDDMYRKIADLGLCVSGQSVLDIGTGTGVLPRNMHKYGANWTGADVSRDQIEQAEQLSKGMDIRYITAAAEDLRFSDGSFDVITACQCFWYFNHDQVMPRFRSMLKTGGSILILYMAWLPSEDAIAKASEALVLKYNPSWSGAGETLRPIAIPECYEESFDQVFAEEYKVQIPFTRETWHGRIKACRGTGASLTSAELAAWEQEHRALLEDIAPAEFDVKHYVALAQLKLR